MKLHLPHSLRKSVVACLAAVSLTLASGLVVQTGAAAEINYDPVSGIPEAGWSATSIGEYDFTSGDNVSFFKPAIITLESNIRAGVVNVRNNAELTLIGAGSTLDARGIDLGMNTVLTLRDNALAGGTALTQSSGALLRFDWGSITSSFDAHLSEYRGSIAVHNSTLNTTPGTATSWDRLVMEGVSTLQLGSGAALRAPITLLGAHTINVASGTATLSGEVSGDGTITKTGTGTLVLDLNDEVHTGELIVAGGTVQWGEGAESFRRIVVNSGAIFNDTRKNVPLSVRELTDVVLNNGGKMTGAPATWIVYKSLTVNGSATVEGNRRFALLSGQGTLTVGTGTTRLETIRDFTGTIAGSATKLMIDLVDVAEGETVTVSRAVSPDTLTKVGAGTLTISGAVSADNDLVVQEGPMNVNGALTATNAIFTGDCTYRNTGNVTTRGFFSVTGDETDVTVTGALTAGTHSTMSTGLVDGTIGVQPTLEMAGKALHITGATTATGTLSFTSGTSTLGGNLTATQYGGMYASNVLISGEGTQVSIGGALQTGSLDMAGQSLGVSGIMTVNHDATLHAGATTAASANIGGNATLDNSSLTLQTSLTAANVSVNASTLTAGSITVSGDLAMGGGSTVRATGTVTTDSFDLADGTFTCGDILSVRKMLTMNYTGDFSHSGEMTLGGTAGVRDIVLSYASGRDAVHSLSTGELFGLDVIYVDVSRVSEEDLRQGIDLGIGKSAAEMLSIAQLKGSGYTIDDSGATLVLKAASKKPALSWDANWGVVETAAAPETINALKWDIIAEKEGLFRSPYYDNNSYLIAANVSSGEETPTVLDHDQLLFGGAYSPQSVEPEGGTIERDIWLNIEAGDFTMVTGGSLYGPATIDGRTLGRWNLVGDTHVQITSGVLRVGSVMGSNFLDGAHTGNSYVSIYSPRVSGSIYGSIYGDAGNTVQTGDTYVYVYTNLPQAADTHFIERTMSEEEQGAWERWINQNAVVGGSFSGNGTANMNGDTHVVFDFSDLPDSTLTLNTVKNVVAGNWGNNARMTGDSNVSFIHMTGAAFGGVATAGHNGTTGTANQQQTGSGTFLVSDAHSTRFGGTVSGAHITTAGSGTQARTGDSLIRVQESSGITFNGVVTGDHYWSATVTSSSQTHSGNTAIEVLGTSGVAFSNVVTASSYLRQSDPKRQSGNVTQTNTGNTTILVKDAPRTTFSGAVASGGSYAFLSDEMPATLNQGNTGKIEFLILDSPTTSAQAIMVGGHYACDTVDEPAPDPRPEPRTTITQGQTGDILMCIANSEGSSFNSNIVVGHYATTVTSDEEPLPTLSVTQNQTGNSTLNIIDVGSSRFGGEWVVGGHFSDAVLQNNVTQTHNSASINININSGVFAAKLVGGDVEDTNATSRSTISGDINLNLSNARFGGTVTGGSCGIGTASVNDITFNVDSCTFSTLIGGHNNCGGTAGNITLNLNNASVTSALYGGSIGNVTQGEIVINMKGGYYAGVIYAGGDATRSLSTRVDIADDVQLAKGILICGGYPGLGPGRVTGTQTLAFSSAGSRYANIQNAVFDYFDTIEVTEADTTVTLNENLQLLDDAVTKTGKGTLEIFHTNDLDTVIVREGRLRLAANCVETSMIEHLHVAEGGILDITEGNSGINGIVTLAEGSTLACSVNQYAPTVTNIDWAGKVNLEVAGATPAISEGGYTIALFKADATHGLTRADVTGLTLGVVSGIEGLATRADAYVKSVTEGFSTDGAYLVLRDNTLYLTNKEAPGRYWLGGSGAWNESTKTWSQSETDTTALTTYVEGARTFFIGQDASPVTVTLGEDESAFSVTVRDGVFTIAEGAGERITLERGDLVVQNGEAHIHPEVVFAEYSGITVDDDSVLTMDGNSAVTVYNLSNGGTIDVGATTPLTVKNIMQNSGSITAGDTELGHGTAQGGTLHVENLKLGGDTTFAQLDAAAVTGNQGHTLTINGDAASSIGSLDGGSLAVQNGSLAISTAASTALVSLQGNGSLTTAGALSIASAGTIGNLTTPELAVGTSLVVSGELVTDSITLGSVHLDAPTVHSGSLDSATDGHTVDVWADSSVFTGLYPMDGKSYYIVKSATDTAAPLTINGHEDSETVYANRYAYTLTVKDDGIEMKGALANTSYYEDNATTKNGRAGASMLDKLFTDGQFEKLQSDAPNGTVMQILHRMDQLALGGAHGELDRLAASAAGASIATMGLAFNEDIGRQLRAMRNRSTVMGLPSCEVHNDLPYVNAWINAEGNFNKMSADTTQCGYELKSWGGTVGLDVDCTSAFTAALAVTAMHGNYRTSGSADVLDGSTNTMYASLMGRYSSKAWSHTFAASVGFARFDVDRKVNAAGIAYGAKGKTDGTGFGFMYELGYAYSLSESASIQPILNLSYVHGGLGGYTESGSDAALRVDGMDCNTFTVAAGARIQKATEPDAYSRSILLEGRALIKMVTGDTEAEAKTALNAAPNSKATLKSAKAGNVGLEIGGGISIPVGQESSFIFVDVSAELRNRYTNANGTVGYRINF
ncbi:MAG: autotransporter domain-containing protein [Akkermansia sp.]|nr:autotransporter domain-containing protein [Akkermansia sp.]